MNVVYPRNGGVTLQTVEKDIQTGADVHGSRTGLGVVGVHYTEGRLHHTAGNTGLE